MKWYWIVHPDDGRRDRVSEKRLGVLRAKMRYLRKSHPLRRATITELSVGESYSCASCQESVTYPHTCPPHTHYF